jgi:hypothetical protein
VFITQDHEHDQAVGFISALMNTGDDVACQAALDLISRLTSMVEVGCLEKCHG